MLLSKEHLFCYIFFIICIALITYLYINFNKNKSENFYANSESNPNIISPFSDSEISNVSVKNAINNELASINALFNKYSKIDPAIIVNNDGSLCDNKIDNSCKIIKNSGTKDKQCLTNNAIISCSTFFSDGYINKQIKLDIKTLNQITRNNIIRNAGQLIDNFKKQISEVDIVLDALIDKINLNDQQTNFVKYNIVNINDKTNLVNKTKEETEKNENDININKINFSNFLSKNNNDTNKINFYYKIIIGLIITMVIVGIVNLFVTKME